MGQKGDKKLRCAWNEMQFGVMWRERSCKTLYAKAPDDNNYDVIEITFPIHEWWSELLQLLQDIFIIEYFKSNPHGLKKENLEKEF
jgi:hypothetical protein